MIEEQANHEARHGNRAALEVLTKENAELRETIEAMRSSGLVAIAAHRGRQMTAVREAVLGEGFDAPGEFARAAAAYALSCCETGDDPHLAFIGEQVWPWGDDAWEPSPDPIQVLACAGAWIAAEIESRVSTSSGQSWSNAYGWFKRTGDRVSVDVDGNGDWLVIDYDAAVAEIAERGVTNLKELWRRHALPSQAE